MGCRVQVVGCRVEGGQSLDLLPEGLAEVDAEVDITGVPRS